MFVQIMEGRVADVEGMRHLMDVWTEELRPGAAGFLGSTAGVTDDGRSVNIARFESAAAARANSNRPEQGEWWSKVEGCYEGEVSFSESEDVETLLGGGSDDAGFVQVMKGHDLDRATIERMDRAFEQHASTLRPDIIGGLRVWTGPDSAYDVTYFVSEEEARSGESKPPPAELSDIMAEMEQVIATTEFFDLSDPWLS